MNQIPQAGEIYQHFKGKLYRIVALATHTETGEQLVIYQALYGDYGVYVRPYEMFISEVDREKYPNVKQKYRFERIDPASLVTGSISGGTDSSSEDSDDFEMMDLEESEEIEPDPNFLRFLETDSYEVRMECLKKMLHTASQRDLDSMYLVLDMKPESGSVEEQVDAIARFLRMQYRYDGSRLR